ncbi:MAG TPA: hypothetical protein VEK35_04410 [Roseiarcus sp.]|nr:hypothetical protein [Roseiarcus sp.]
MHYLITLAALVAATQAALADEATFNLSARVKVGETTQLAVVGSHKSDCKTSVSGAVEVTRAPQIGTLSQRYNVPYIFRRSISHTCYGASLVGTAIDYAANKPGVDRVEFDAVFPNGRAHYIISIVSH